MTKAITLIVLAVACMFFPSCVAGGSGVRIEAKKSDKKIDLKIKYSAYGGANLRKLKTCIVQYGPKSSIESTKVIAVEILRKKEVVEWAASTPKLDNLNKLPLRLTFLTDDLIGRNTITDWIINTSNLTGEYQSINP